MYVSKGQWSSGLKFDDSSAAGTLALTTSSQQHTLAGPGELYIVMAVGTTAYLLGGANPTATAAVDGHSICVPESSWIGPIPLTGPKIAYICAAGSGKIYFIHLDPSL